MICLFIDPSDNDAMLLKVNSKGMTTHGITNANDEWWLPLDELSKYTTGWQRDPSPELISKVRIHHTGYLYFENLKLPLCEHHLELFI